MLRQLLLAFGAKLLLVGSALDATGGGLDLIEHEPLGLRRVASVPVASIEVQGEAKAHVRGDTLEVILAGRPGARLRIPLASHRRAPIDRVRLRLGASADTWVQPGWEHRGEVDAAAKLRTVGAGAPVAVELLVPQNVGPHGLEAPTALILALPSLVGRIQFVGEVQLWGSDAPRCTARWPELEFEARSLAAGDSVEWRVELPPQAHLRVDVAALELSASQPSLRFHVDIETASQEYDTTSFELLAAPADAPLRSLLVDLGRFDPTARLLRLRVEGPPTAPQRGRVVLAAPRITSLDDVRPPVLLIVIDTLRRDDPFADRLLSRPHLTRLERESQAFTNARANSSWTLPSTATLLSGWLPSRHGLGHDEAATARLSLHAPLLADELRAAGWNTAAVSANPLIAPGAGLERGFQSFDTRSARDPRTPSAELAVGAALDWLRERVGTPWMLYLHLFDPHDPYQAPPPWRTRFVREDRRAEDHPSGVWLGRPDLLRDALIRRDPSIRVRERDVELLAELHRGEIAYVDHQVGALLDSLRAWGEFDRSVVLLTSDHGEEFLEHGMLKHGHALHEELIAVPLTLRLPGMVPRNFDHAVSLVDVAPTLRTWLGLKAQSGDGHDLVPLLRGEDTWSGAAPSIAELVSRAGGAWAGTWRSVVDFPWKWIQTPQGEQLFRLDTDPHEREDLHARFRAIGARLRAHADSVGADSHRTAERLPVHPDQLEALRSLGYID